MQKTICQLISILLLAFSTVTNAEEVIDFSSDVRFGAFGRDRDQRDGSHYRRDQLRIRVRACVKVNFSDLFSGKVRFAGRYSLDDRFNT